MIIAAMVAFLNMDGPELLRQDRGGFVALSGQRLLELLPFFHLLVDARLADQAVYKKDEGERNDNPCKAITKAP